MALITRWTKYVNSMGELYFGSDDWNGKAGFKIRSNIQNAADLRGLQMAAKELEEKLRLDIKVNAVAKMTPEELRNLCESATEALECGKTDNVDELVDQPLIDVYEVVCTGVAF